ncbi:hypothetical protein Hamer_G029109 [Homarus americanus]|uniref:Uncharacterized protein n=1 Tax=Homarus americanus TaxID=6706 RepID=A0A8J5MY65_HOMAM|nr:hypothetical protein Hamer_G029109 [Homarus americanus]
MNQVNPPTPDSLCRVEKLFGNTRILRSGLVNIKCEDSSITSPHLTLLHLTSNNQLTPTVQQHSSVGLQVTMARQQEAGQDIRELMNSLGLSGFWSYSRIRTRSRTALDGIGTADKELINDMIVPLLHQWTKANALFKPPVINQCRTIELKLTKLWHKAVETSLGKGNLARKNEFLHTLDTLFDILTCKCSIQLCSESNCSHSGKRENNSHIDCGCPREKKIPVLELEFIKAQRTKAEGQGSMQMGSIDYSETKKQIANAKKREQIREREQKKKMKSEEAIQREEELCQDVYHFFDSSSDEQEATSDDIPPINVNATKLSELVDLSLEVLEPPLTTSLTSQELRNLKETPMQVPKWPSHTQSVERCVKMVTEAAGHSGFCGDPVRTSGRGGGTEGEGEGEERREGEGRKERSDGGRRRKGRMEGKEGREGGRRGSGRGEGRVLTSSSSLSEWTFVFLQLRTERS